MKKAISPLKTPLAKIVANGCLNRIGSIIKKFSPTQKNSCVGNFLGLGSNITKSVRRELFPSNENKQVCIENKQELYQSAQKNLKELKFSILSLLSRNDLSCSDIHRKLNLPINKWFVWSVMMILEQTGFVKPYYEKYGNGYRRGKYTIINNSFDDIWNKIKYHDSVETNSHMSAGIQNIIKILKKKGAEYDTEKRFPSCKDKRTLPFDIFIPQLNLLIEFDGEQHFKPVKCWGGIDVLRKTQHHDKIKNDWAFDNGYHLLRIDFNNKSVDLIERSIDLMYKKIINNKNKKNKNNKEPVHLFIGNY